MNYKQTIGGLVIFACVALVGYQQQPKKFSVSLTIDQWNDYIGIVNDAKLDGDSRRFLTKQLTDQLQPQVDAWQKAQKDSTGNKPKQ